MFVLLARCGVAAIRHRNPRSGSLWHGVLRRPAADPNRTDDLFTTKELDTPKVLIQLASDAPTMASQLGPHDRAEIVHVQSMPTPAPLIVWTYGLAPRVSRVVALAG